MNVYQPVTKETSELKDILCDRCGKTLKVYVHKSWDDSGKIILDNEVEFEGLSVDKLWGYWSNRDMERWEFDLCLECCELLKKFVEELGGKITITNSLGL